MSLADPGQLPLIASVLGRGTAAALLVVAGIVALRPTPDVAWRPALLLVVPAATVALVILLAARIQEALPMLVDASTLAAIARHPEAVAADGLGLVAGRRPAARRRSALPPRRCSRIGRGGATGVSARRCWRPG